MKSRLLAVAVGVATIYAGNASAAVFGDDLARCLVTKATSADRDVFIQWMFSAMAAHPAVAGLSNMTVAQRQEHTHQAGKLFQRLMLDDCRKETVAAIKNEGPEALSLSFGTLGRAAMTNLMSEPLVTKEMGGLTDGLDKARWAALAKEIGVPPETFPGAR